MNKWLIAGVIAAAVLLSSGGMFLLRWGEPVDTAPVVRGRITEFVDERGKTRLPEIHRITMPFSGRIEPIQLVEGQRVAKGQVVAQIVPSDLQLAIDQARAAVDRFAAAIEENEDHSVEHRAREQANELVDLMIKTAQAANARLTSSEKRLQYARQYRKELEDLFQQQATSEDEFERAQVDEVDRQVQYAQDALIWQAAESMRKAAELLPKIIDAYVNRKAKTRRVLEHQKAEAQARLNEMLTRKQRGTMRSPVDGVVLACLVKNERFLPAGIELLRIGQIERLEVEADVLSLDVGRIHPGDRAEIYGPAVGAEAGDGVPGVVRRIYPAAFTKISSLGVEQQRVKVIIGFDKDALGRLLRRRNLGVEFRVRVRIITDEKADALLVPRSALFRGPDGSGQVFVVRGWRARQPRVEVGLINDRHAEIRSGLQEGDRVVVAPESNLRDAMRVRLSR